VGVGISQIAEELLELVLVGVWVAVRPRKLIERSLEFVDWICEAYRERDGP
jgi:hypothetical protein